MSHELWQARGRTGCRSYCRAGVFRPGRHLLGAGVQGRACRFSAQQYWDETLPWFCSHSPGRVPSVREQLDHRMLQSQRLEEISKITERTHLQHLDPHHSSCLTSCLHAPRPLQGSSRGTLQLLWLQPWNQWLWQRHRARTRLPVTQTQQGQGAAPTSCFAPSATEGFNWADQGDPALFPACRMSHH